MPASQVLTINPLDLLALIGDDAKDFNTLKIGKAVVSAILFFRKERRCCII
jgi:hypothetical protein